MRGGSDVSYSLPPRPARSQLSNLINKHYRGECWVGWRSGGERVFMKIRIALSVNLLIFAQKSSFVVFLSFGVYFLLSHFVVILSARSPVYVRIIKFMCVDIAKEALRSVFDGDAENDILYLLYFNSEDDSDGVEERKVFANKYFKGERKVFLLTKRKTMQSADVKRIARCLRRKDIFTFLVGK